MLAKAALPYELTLEDAWLGFLADRGGHGVNVAASLLEVTFQFEVGSAKYHRVLSD